jgi:hypothetical protein
MIEYLELFLLFLIPIISIGQYTLKIKTHLYIPSLIKQNIYHLNIMNTVYRTIIKENLVLEVDTILEYLINAILIHIVILVLVILILLLKVFHMEVMKHNVI